MDIHSVIGLGFGDEGKGVVVDYLCSQYDIPSDVCVIRHSGGHQVGHTVKLGDITHTFHHFCAGTLRGAMSVWGKGVTLSPIHFRHERDVLLMKKLPVTPSFGTYDNNPITTVYDIAFDRVTNKGNTVGVGYMQTIVRNELISFILSDLEFPTIRKMKLRNIYNYYFSKCKELNLVDRFMEEVATLELDRFSFEEDCDYLYQNSIQFSSDQIPYGHLIFEGNQGVLLDREHGFYPYVTYGKTTNHGLLAHLKDEVRNSVTKWYCLRAYLTRHGAGPLPGEQELNLVNNENETNITNLYQGQLRTAPLSMELFNYALNKDRQDFSYRGANRFVISCLDQVENPEQVIKTIQKEIYAKLFVNTSPESKTIKEWVNGTGF